MKEQVRLAFQQRYQQICRDQGWLTAENESVWPEEPEVRAIAAREMFGLALIAGTDSTFWDVKEELAAEELKGTATLKSALEVLRALSDEQKSAVLTLVDDVLDSCVYRFSIQLDCFDHGFLSLRFQAMDDEECVPLPETEVEINPCGYFEMFQDALRWREEYGMGTDIGRPEDPGETRTDGST